MQEQKWYEIRYLANCHTPNKTIPILGLTGSGVIFQSLKNLVSATLKIYYSQKIVKAKGTDGLDNHKTGVKEEMRNLHEEIFKGCLFFK